MYDEEERYYPDVHITKVEIEIDHAAIINLAATRLLSQLIQKDSDIRTLVRDITEDEIRTSVKPLVEQAIQESRQPTDSFGNPKGNPTTLTEQIEKAVHELLTKETGDYNRRETFVRKFIREEVEKAVKADLQATMEAARLQVREAVKSEAATLIAQTIERMAR